MKTVACHLRLSMMVSQSSCNSLLPRVNVGPGSFDRTPTNGQTVNLLAQRLPRAEKSAAQRKDALHGFTETTIDATARLERGCLRSGVELLGIRCQEI